MSYDWRQISKSPISAEVKSALRRTLAQRRRPRVTNKRKLVEEFVRGHDVLDIGVVEHALEHVESPEWLHAHVKTAARSTLGIDILEEEVKTLRERGYDVMVADATSDLDVGRRFDRVVLGDIIEHVSDPVSLVKFAARHLRPGGKVLVTTPNPLYFAWSYESVRQGAVIANAEHISWIGPTMALEIAHRAGVELEEYRLLSPIPERQTWKYRMMRVFADRFLGEQEVLAPWFAYVFILPVA